MVEKSALTDILGKAKLNGHLHNCLVEYSDSLFVEDTCQGALKRQVSLLSRRKAVESNHYIIQNDSAWEGWDNEGIAGIAE